MSHFLIAFCCLALTFSFTGCQESKLDKNLDNMSEVMSRARDYTELRENTQSSIDTAQEYEMNVISCLALDQSWNILNPPEGSTEDINTPKGKYSKEELEKVTGSTVEEAEERYDKLDTEERVALGTADKLLIADISIKYYINIDTNKLTQVFNITHNIYTKEIVVTWSEGKVVDYVETCQ